MLLALAACVLTLSTENKCVCGHKLSDVKRLKTSLFLKDSYDKTLRPVMNQSKPIKVGINILHLYLSFCLHVFFS